MTSHALEIIGLNKAFGGLSGLSSLALSFSLGLERGVKDLKSPDLAIFRFPFTPTTPFISGLCARKYSFSERIHHSSMMDLICS